MFESLSASSQTSVSGPMTESCCFVEQTPVQSVNISTLDTRVKTVNPENPVASEQSEASASSASGTQPQTDPSELRNTASQDAVSNFSSVFGERQDSGGRKVCAFFQKTGWCRFGSNCRYLHSHASSSNVGDEIQLRKADPHSPEQGPTHSSSEDAATKEKGDAASSASQRNICRFFAKSGWCRYGYRCRYAHVSEKSAHDEVSAPRGGEKNVKSGDDEEPLTESVTLLSVDDDATQRREIGRNSQQKHCRYYVRGHCWMGQHCTFLHVHRPSEQTQDDVQSKDNDLGEGEWKPAKKPVTTASITSRSVADLQDGDLEQMRDNEIGQLKKQFPGGKLQVGGDQDNPSYRFTVIPSDPDWPYDLKHFELQVSFPADYPMQPLQLDLPEDQVLPNVILRHISPAIEEWITARYATNQLTGRVELMVRPFLRWFDRNLMRLFTDGAHLFKKQVYAKAAGLEFVSYSQGDESSNPKEDASLSGEGAVGRDGEGEDDKGAEDESEEEYDDDRDTDDYDEDDDGGNSSSEFEEEDRASANALVSSPLHNVLSKLSSMYESPTDNRRGTEIRFNELQMSELAATLTCQKTKLRIQCSRCKAQYDVSAMPGHAMVVGCSKCQTQQAVSYRPCIMHPFSSVLGFLDITGCVPVDLIIFDCHFLITCLNCSSETNVQGIQYGQNRMVWCSTCHQKMSVGVESAKFHRLVASVPEGKTQVVAVKKERKVKDPAIREGFPLPDNGACKHYKKSFRWMRFPCCGKCYPCDECHDRAELDHEMKYATRMICGFCCKEQTFSKDKPCISCGSLTTKSTTQHWEGGTGCRNKTKMSKNDKQKYSSINKTTSRRSQKVDDQCQGKRK